MADDPAVTESGKGAPVVLVHGTAPPAWGSLVEDLATDHRVVTFHRRSDPPAIGGPVASLRTHTDDLGRLIDRLDGHAIVVGWSIGGVIALDLARRRPQTVDGLVVLEPPLHVKTHPSLALLRAVIGAQLAKKDPPRAARRFLSWALARRDGSNDLGRFDRDDLDRCAPAIVAEIGLGTGEKEIRSTDLASIAPPARWLIGAEGTKDFARAADRARRVWPELEVEVVPGAGHCLPLDRPEVVAAHVRQLSHLADDRTNRQ
jgi:pimeloyl-ACP methyl ester carboxylesterase